MNVCKFISLAYIILCSACNRGFNEKAKPGEGTVTYKVTYPDSMKFGLKSALLPKTITLFFKGEKATFVASAGMGTIQIVDLIDHQARTYTSLFIDELRGNYGCKRTPEEITEKENNPVFEFKPENESKIIAGLACSKAIVNDVSNNTTFEIYYHNKLKFYYMSSPFVNQPNLMLEYDHTINNLTMKLKAIKVDLVTPVDTTMFQIKGNYKWLNEKDYYAYLNSLK